MNQKDLLSKVQKKSMDHPLEGSIFYVRDTKNLTTNVKIEADRNYLALFKDNESLICTNKDADKALPLYLHKVSDSANTYKVFSCKTGKWWSKENVTGSDIWIQFATERNDIAKAASIEFKKQDSGEYKFWSKDMSRYVFSMTGND
jgi:hypothetical protein